MSTVAIFDSGVGGLSIYQAVSAMQPDLDYVFVSDNQAFPYGTKDEAELIERVVKVVKAIAERYAPQILVVACNTASTVVLPILRQQFDFSIVGVVPAIRPASAFSETRQIALLATPATISRPYTDQLIADYANDCTVLKLGSSELVALAEQKLYGDLVDLNRLENILEPILSQPSIDVVVLACTHFPLLKEELKQVFDQHGRSIHLLDSSNGIANRVADISKELALDVNSNVNNRSRAAAFTDAVTEQTVYLSTLEKIGFNDIQILHV